MGEMAGVRIVRRHSSKLLVLRAALGTLGSIIVVVLSPTTVIGPHKYI